jgi:hypothetical protein
MILNNYSEYSPYKETPFNGYYLDVWTPRQVPALDDDVMVELPSQYQHRPDLLANDAYGDPRLWWVFAIRNPSVIKDPIYDLVSGIKIYIPQKQKLLAVLGSSRT